MHRVDEAPQILEQTGTDEAQGDVGSEESLEHVVCFVHKRLDVVK